MKPAVIAVCLFAVCLLFGCTQANRSIVGRYGTYSPHRGERMALEKRFQAQVYPLPAMMICLRSDQVYVMSYCDNQIAEAGQYRAEGDSVFLYNRFSLRRGQMMPERKMFFNHPKRTFYFINYQEEESRKPGFTEALVPVRENWWKAHTGYIRGENLSLDSILHHYEHQTVAEQQAWTDSMRSVRPNTVRQ